MPSETKLHMFLASTKSKVLRHLSHSTAKKSPSISVPSSIGEHTPTSRPRSAIAASQPLPSHTPDITAASFPTNIAPQAQALEGFNSEGSHPIASDEPEDPSGNDTLWLPDDDILGNGDITGMMNLAHSKRAEYSTRKSIAEHRLRLCEKEIGSLRQDVADADRDLQEVDMKFAALRRILHNPNSSANTSWDQQNHGTSPYRSNISDYSSDSSSMGSSSKD